MKKVERKSRTKSSGKVPKGFHTVTPFLMVNDARGLIEFMERAFNGEVTAKVKDDGGKIMHATVQIGDSLVMVADVMTGTQPMPSMLYLYVDDVDATYKQAIGVSGTKSLREPIDEFYGDRSAGIKDEWNNQWWLATHVEDVSDEEMERRKEEFLHKRENMSNA